MIAETLAAEIIKEQSLIVGEVVAKGRAEDAGIIKFKSSKIDDLIFTQPNPSLVIERLIKSYEELFGQASVEVCLEVIKKHPFSEVTSFLPEAFRKRLGAYI